MASNEISLKWTRPESVEYPKVWHRFMARDLDNDNMVEYRIEDLSIERANEAIQHMKENFLRDEPITEALRECAKNISLLKKNNEKIKCDSKFQQIKYAKTQILLTTTSSF